MKTVRNLIVLDASGSMMSIYNAALNGLNETIQSIRASQAENGDMLQIVDLVTFNSQSYNIIYKATPAAQAADIAPAQFQPNACTPLFDAMGKALSSMSIVAKPDDVVLVTIITDGEENASREFSGRAIHDMVKALKEKGWVFTYIGANQDVDAVADKMGINNKLSFETNPTSTHRMFANYSCSRKSFIDKVKRGASSDELSSDFFN